MTLVLTHFKIDPSASSGLLVHLAGRRPGVLAWILRKIGLVHDLEFRASREQVVVGSRVAKRGAHHMVPLSEVASTLCAYEPPRSLLYLAGFLGLLGTIFTITMFTERLTGTAITGIFVTLVFVGICLLVYVLNKQMTISVETRGGARIGLTFRPSIIEGVRVDMARAIEAIDLLNSHVMASKGATPVRVEPVAPRPHVPGPPPVRVRDIT